MDAIRSYIDQMFRSLPQTAEVRRAHAELLQMSEDRYHELRGEGVSDHEAVGRVITQFGNLDELADELGIRREVDGLAADAVDLSAEEAERFLANRRRGGWFIAGGVFAILAGLASTMLVNEAIAPGTERWGAIGLAVFFVAVAVAVGLFITGGMSMSRYDRLEGRELRLDPATAARFRERRERETGTFTAAIVSGVVLIILGVAFVAVTSAVRGDAASNVWGVVGMFLAIGVGVGILTKAGIRRGALDRLTVESAASDTKQSSLIGLVAGPYWMLALLVFLAWSFISGDWHQTWIVWPIAGVLFGFIAATLGAVESHRDRR